MAEWGVELDSLACKMDSGAGFRPGTSGRSSQIGAGTRSGLLKVRAKRWMGDWGPETSAHGQVAETLCRMGWGPVNGWVVLVSQES